MRLLAGWAVGCCVLLAATAAHAQGAGRYGSPYAGVSDFDEPYYGEMAPRGPLNRGDRMAFLPPHEVYDAARESGFSPIGVPRLRGFTYVITAVDRRGDDGRLVIDARTGQILNFTPAYRMGEGYEEGANYGGPPGPPGAYGPPGPYGARSAAVPPPMPAASAGPRPPAPIPHVASRAVPAPMPRPLPPAPAVAARPEVAPQPPQQSATVEPKPAVAAATAAPLSSAPAPTATVGQAKPNQQILPTQPMPQAQGLEY